MIDLLIVTFASWYLAYAATSTHGPFAVFVRLREWRGGWWHGRTKKLVEVNEHGNKWEMEKAGLLDCPICLAPWVALALLLAPMGVVTQALGVAGLAMIFHGWSGWRFAQ